MEKCKLKKGDRIYECRYREATLTELIEDPQVRVQGGDSHYWHWKARVIETSSYNVAPGDVVEYGILEEASHYGPSLYRQNVYEVGADNAERILPPFDTTRETVIKKVSIADDVEILGHVFHGLEDIRKHVEMSLYKRYSYGPADEQKQEKTCEVHVGEMWMPYPCFDAEDYANEDRTYQNFVFRDRPITQDDMKALSELRSKGDECRVSELMPAEVLPVVYYVGEGGIMLVAM